MLRYFRNCLKTCNFLLWSDFETGMRKNDMFCFKLSYIIRFIVNNLTHYGYFKCLV